MLPRTLALAGTALAACLLLVPAPSAQSNEIPGTDVSLGILGGITWKGRTGAFPNGMNGIAMDTTSCNKGTVQVPWLAAGSGNMGEDHPLIAFIIAREADGRMIQISDKSYVKHGFFALANSQCDPCQGGSPQGTFLGIGCSDTYTHFNNGDNYWLGPADEINPWLGSWDKFCSYFDMGDPPVAPPNDCNGQRSFTSQMAAALGPVGHRINVSDQDLGAPGNYFYQGYYVIRGEPDQNRGNNMVSRAMTPTWTGSQWNLANPGSQLQGSVLRRWQGATFSSGQNGDDDGLVWIGQTVTGPEQGFYHYELALHNRDNNRGISEFRLPKCDGAQITNFGFHDIDGDAGNDWTMTDNGTEVVFSTNDNPLRWNTIYNIWFDSDAGPGNVTSTLTQFDPGVGAGSFTIGVEGPSQLHNPWLGAGCSDTTAPSLYATGSPPQATLGNASFGLESSGNDAGGLTLWFLDFIPGNLDLGGGCTIYLGGILGVTQFNIASNLADGGGVSTLPLAIPNDVTLEGADLYWQILSLRGAGGPAFGLFDLSNGLQVRVGDSVTDCP